MGHVRLQRTIAVDVPIILRKSRGGPLTDDADWTDGLTDDQWPTATWKNTSSEVDVTSDFVKDITADTIASATHKHPDPTTGLWRSAEGRYWVRVEPALALTLTDYDLDVQFDVSSTAQYDETHIYELVLPGDIDFGDVLSTVITTADVEAGLSTTMDDPGIAALIEESADWASGWLLENCDTDADSLNPIPKSIITSVLLYTRILVLEYDMGAGLKPLEIQEAGDRIRFGGRDQRALDRLMDRAEAGLKAFCFKKKAGRAFSYGAFNAAGEVVQ